MERMHKQGNETGRGSRTAQARFTSRSRELEKGIDESPAMVAQRQRLDRLFGPAIQRAEDAHRKKRAPDSAKAGGTQCRAVSQGNRGGSTEVIQRLEDVYSKEAFDDPAHFMRDRFNDAAIHEDSGSGGIMDEPVQTLVRGLQTKDGRDQIAQALEPRSEELASDLRWRVYDWPSAYAWVRQNTLKITNVAPDLLTVARQDGDGGQPHTYHRDRGLATMKEEDLNAKGARHPEDIQLRVSIANGPFRTGWVLGHRTVANGKHKYIEHVHVDKARADDERIDIYNTNDPEHGKQAKEFAEQRHELHKDNMNRERLAGEDIELARKMSAWEEFERTLPEFGY